VFAPGNLLHGAESAAVAALSGRHAASAIRSWLTDSAWPAVHRYRSGYPAAAMGRPGGHHQYRGPSARERLILRVDQFANGRLGRSAKMDSSYELDGVVWSPAAPSSLRLAGYSGSTSPVVL
jgi:hypothetical protein